MMGSLCQAALNKRAVLQPNLGLKVHRMHVGEKRELTDLLWTLHQTTSVRNERRRSAWQRSRGGDAASVQKVRRLDWNVGGGTTKHLISHLSSFALAPFFFLPPVMHFYQSQVKVWAWKLLMNEEQSWAETNHLGSAWRKKMAKSCLNLYCFPLIFLHWRTSK